MWFGKNGDVTLNLLKVSTLDGTPLDRFTENKYITILLDNALSCQFTFAVNNRMCSSLTYSARKTLVQSRASLHGVTQHIY